MVLLGYIEMMAMDRDCPEKLEAHAAKVKASAERISSIVKKIHALHNDRVIPFGEHGSIIYLDSSFLK